MADNTEVRHVASASREIAARAEQVFELIADPSQQPRWDGNDNLAEAPAGQRVHGVGDVFTMTTTKGSVPSLIAYQIRESKNDRFWTRIGVAWTSKDEKGLVIQLNAMPLDGKIVLRLPDPKDAA